MAQRRRSGKGEPLLRAAPGERPSARTSKKRMLIEPPLYLLEKRPMRSPFGIPQSRRRMHCGGKTQALQFGPQRLIKRMGKITSFEEHRPDEYAAKAWQLRYPPQFFDRVVDIL